MSAFLNTSSTQAAVSARSGQSAGAFAASLVTAIVIFAVEMLAFIMIKDRFSRIYQPRTYLVPEKERTTPPSPGWWEWIKPVIKTSNSEFIQKCGLDAYFFLRYLRTLLKIFVPAALIILPILLPLNLVGGRGANFAVGQFANLTNVTGLDVLAWGNVRPQNTKRYWAHWLLAVGLIVWVCYVAFDELKNYIRMRQAYMTSPQHRLRASATTVLVSSIPQKWCTVEALEGLYDVFPGGLRNIWINRNFDELQEKVEWRDYLARQLETAETDLIQRCFKKNEEKLAKAAKAAGQKLSKDDKKRQEAANDEKGVRNAFGHGVTSGNPHQVVHSVRDATDGAAEHESSDDEVEVQDSRRERPFVPIAIIGQGIQTMTSGIQNLGQNIGQGIMGGIRGVNKEVNNTIDTTNGFVPPSNDQTAGGNELGPRRQQYAHGSTMDGHVKNQKTFGAPGPQRSVVDATASPRSQTDSEANWDRGRTIVRPENDKQLLGQPSPTDSNAKELPEKPHGIVHGLLGAIGLAAAPKEEVEYPAAFSDEFAKDTDDAAWKKYIDEKDRPTSHLPIFGWHWFPALPFIGQKIDTIYYCRKEVARLNVEIEDDQANPERFPLMNSAFVQFNHQVAAHMACQALSHHIPNQMAPRLVEIDPNDVIWENMSIPWWQRYIRTAAVFTTVAGMIVLWAIPVAFTSALSQLTYLAQSVEWLHWLLKAPPVILSILQGVLPATVLAILMFLLPLILRFLSKMQGTQSGMLIELSVQKYYFFFVFVQLFLVVTVASAAAVFFSYFKNVNGFTNIPTLLAENIPKASNYFFSYMLLQALSVSAGALLQVGSLVSWFVLAPMLDNTARSKFQRQTGLSNVQWGTFFPVYTNLASIGLIYSVISPLILVFNIITFTLFWFAYRYNTLYVTKFTRDTGGLLYPNAINATFTGLYVLEIALIGLFFLVRDAHGNVACTGQAIAMIIILILTGIYQILLNHAFSPLFRYLPITLEDDATRRDQEFARAMNKKQIQMIEDDVEGNDIEGELERREHEEMNDNRDAEQYELHRIEADKRKRLRNLQSEELPELAPYEFQNPEINLDVDSGMNAYGLFRKTAEKAAGATLNKLPIPAVTNKRKSWADRSDSRNQRAVKFGNEETAEKSESFSATPGVQPSQRKRAASKPAAIQALERLNNFNPLLGNQRDIEAQQAARNQLSNALFAGLNDELEDLTPDQRDTLVQRAFQHSALRARRPVIWLPRDDLGVSDDEVKRMAMFSKHLWVSNVRQGLDSKGRCVYSGAPPDFSEVDLIQL